MVQEVGAEHGRRLEPFGDDEAIDVLGREGPDPDRLEGDPPRVNLLAVIETTSGVPSISGLIPSLAAESADIRIRSTVGSRTMSTD